MPLELLNVKPAGKTSLTITSWAISGPLFLTVKVHLTKSPYFGAVTLATLTIDKSIALGTVIFCESWLFVVFQSNSLALTVALFVMLPVLLIKVVILIVTVLPLAKLPISQTLLA